MWNLLKLISPPHPNSFPPDFSPHSPFLFAKRNEHVAVYMDFDSTIQVYTDTEWLTPHN